MGERIIYLRRYRILLEKKAVKQLKNMSKDARNRIIEVLHILRDEGFSRRLDIVKLRGSEGHYRIRVGKYRILFELAPDKVVIVHAVLPRKAAY